MLAKKRKIYLANGQFIFGVGVKVMVKYSVTELPEGRGFKLAVVSDKKKQKSFFRTAQNFFIEGNTLYSHGLRLFPYTKKRDREWQAAHYKKQLVSKLDLFGKIIGQIKSASQHKTILISCVVDNALKDMALHDKGIRNLVRKYFEE